MDKWVYTFGNGTAEGASGMKELLGGKGANLAEMSSLGLPVPPGFTITTEACNWYYANGETYPKTLEAQLTNALGTIEAATNRKFGDALRRFSSLFDPARALRCPASGIRTTRPGRSSSRPNSPTKRPRISWRD